MGNGRGFTRRSLVKGALLYGANLAFAAPRNVFPAKPRTRIAVASYPFRAMIDAPGNEERDPKKPGMDLAAFAKFVRTDFGVRGIEPLDSHFASTAPAELRKLRAAFDAAGVYVVNIPVDEAVELCGEDAAKRFAGLERYRHWIDVAVFLRSPGIRVWIPKCRDTSDLSKAMAALKPALEYAATRNVVVNLENDDPVSASADRVLAAISLANTDYLRALPDFGNGLMGGDEHFNAQGVQRMFAHAWNIAHVKDAESVDGVRKTASLEELFGFARASGFRGYYSMESDSKVDPTIDTRHLIEQTLKLM